jgi:hypothetical protein
MTFLHEMCTFLKIHKELSCTLHIFS